MLIALSPDGRRIVGRDAVRDVPYTCPCCHTPVTLRQGRVVVHHFAHRPGALCDNVGETVRHMEMKMAVYDGFAGMDPQLEASILGRRRADVLIDQRGALPFIVECQHSTLSQRELEARAFDYNQVGYLLWVFDSRLFFKKYWPKTGFTRTAGRLSESLVSLIEEYGALHMLHDSRLLYVRFDRSTQHKADEWGSRTLTVYEAVSIEEVKRPWAFDGQGNDWRIVQRPLPQVAPLFVDERAGEWV